MKSILALTFAMLLGPALTAAQIQGTPEWSISDIQQSVLKKIDGTYLDKPNSRNAITRTADKGSIIEVRASFSFLIPTPAIPDISGDNVLITGQVSRNISGTHFPLPGIKLSGTTTELGISKSWSFDPIAVGLNSPTGCSSYLFLDSKADVGVSGSSNGQTVGLDIANGKIRISSGGGVPICFAFPAPSSTGEMRLDMAGTVISIDNKIGTATTVIKIPAARSYEGIFRIGGAGGASAPVCSSQPEPNYSDDGRKAHIQGVVTLDVIIQADGSIEVLRVVRGIGYGLDDEAKKVLKRWKCAPGNVDGHPVATQTQILINFHLH